MLQTILVVMCFFSRQIEKNSWSEYIVQTLLFTQDIIMPADRVDGLCCGCARCLMGVTAPV